MQTHTGPKISPSSFGKPCPEAEKLKYLRECSKACEEAGSAKQFGVLGTLTLLSMTITAAMDV